LREMTGKKRKDPGGKTSIYTPKFWKKKKRYIYIRGSEERIQSPRKSPRLSLPLSIPTLPLHRGQNITPPGSMTSGTGTNCTFVEDLLTFWQRVTVSIPLSVWCPGCLAGIPVIMSDKLVTLLTLWWTTSWAHVSFLITVWLLSISNILVANLAQLNWVPWRRWETFMGQHTAPWMSWDEGYQCTRKKLEGSITVITSPRSKYFSKHV
jgi:hypothetical protein